MVQLEELKAFVATSAFSLLSPENQHEIRDKIIYLEKEAKTQAIKSIADAIKKSVYSIVEYQDLNASFMVKISNGQVEVKAVDDEGKEASISTPTEPLPACPGLSTPALGEKIATEYPFFSGIILTRGLDWSFFNVGFTVPLAQYYAIEKAYGRKLESESVKISIDFKQRTYEATLIMNSDGVMQILWRKAFGLASALRESYPKAYSYIKKNRTPRKSSKGMLPVDLMRRFHFCSTTYPRRFILFEDPTSFIKGIHQNASPTTRWEISGPDKVK